MVVREIIEALRRELPEAFEERGIPPIRRRLERGFEEVLLSDEELPPEYEKGVSIDSDHDVSIEPDPELEREVEEMGTDALAWYQGFHSYKKWGIRIRWRGLLFVVRFLKRGSVRPINSALSRAFKILHSHETFHFLTEWGASFLEMRNLKPCYSEYENMGFRLEEALANAYAYRQLSAVDRRKVKRLFAIQPSEYRDFDGYVGDDQFLLGKRKLGAVLAPSEYRNYIKEVGDDKRILGLSVKRRVDRTKLATLKEISLYPQYELLLNAESFLSREVPTYLVIEPSWRPSLPRFRIAYAGVGVSVYPGDHLPPHIHVRIPKDSRYEKRYKYPSLEPMPSTPPLTNRQRKKLKRLLSFDKIRERIEARLPSSVTKRAPKKLSPE